MCAIQFCVYIAVYINAEIYDRIYAYVPFQMNLWGCIRIYTHNHTNMLHSLATDQPTTWHMEAQSCLLCWRCTCTAVKHEAMIRRCTYAVSIFHCRNTCQHPVTGGEVVMLPYICISTVCGVLAADVNYHHGWEPSLHPPAPENEQRIGSLSRSKPLKLFRVVNLMYVRLCVSSCMCMCMCMRVFVLCLYAHAVHLKASLSCV